MTNLEKLKRLNDRLTALLAEPETGHVMWQLMLAEVISKIAMFEGRNPSAVEDSLADW
jgi:hypothetical protein